MLYGREQPVKKRLLGRRAIQPEYDGYPAHCRREKADAAWSAACIGTPLNKLLPTRDAP